jgi:hypothetical protein
MLINIYIEAEGFPPKEAHLYFDDEHLQLMTNPIGYVRSQLPQLTGYADSCLTSLEHDGWLQKPLTVEMIDIPDPVIQTGKRTHHR